MKKIGIVSIFSVLLFFSTVHAESFSFENNLSLGTESVDVLMLQKKLNENPLTQIAETGVGSPGNETNYFGIKTLEAVKKFQTLHANDILIPAGLTSANGFVGLLTRAKLNTETTKTIKAENIVTPTIEIVSEEENSLDAYLDLGVNEETIDEFSDTIKKLQSEYEKNIKKQVKTSEEIISNVEIIKYSDEAKITLQSDVIGSKNTIVSNSFGSVENVIGKNGEVSFLLKDFSHMKYAKAIADLQGKKLINADMWIVTTDGESDRVTISVNF